MRPVTLHVPDGPVVVEHELEVPLDHDRPKAGQTTVFARELYAPGGADRPALLFLQGGPGGEAERPTFGPTAPGWVDRALRDFRLVLLDQRGTGRSAPLPDPAALPAAAYADLVALHRADAIVADAELLREALGVRRWSLLGQSFGGFCALTYLSVAPDALAAVYLTGGVPPVGLGPDDVYAATYPTMAARSAAYWARYPDDLPRYRRLLDLADEGRLLLPDGSPATRLLLRHTGQVLGMSYGAEHLHHLLERDPASPGFRYGLDEALAFSGRSPLYALLQEACVADGGVTGWSAERTLPPAYAEDPTLFLGEHLLPQTYTETASLAAYAEVAGLLATREWPRLYDPAVLAGNQVPGAAAVYAHDPYVDRGLSLATLAGVPGIAPWVTGLHEHDALRTSGAEVLDRLLATVPPRA